MEEAKGNKYGTSDFPIHDDKSNGAADHKPLTVNGTFKRLSGRVRKSSKGNWTEEEDALLQDAVQRHGGKSWKNVAKCVPGRTDTQCLHRWQKVLNPNLVKGPWSKEEDDLLIKLVGKQPTKNWAEIAVQLPGRMGKQCRERWHNHLKPEINKDPWTKEEETILINAHSEYGNKWSEIAKILPGRTENSVKNHWNCSLKKKLGNFSANGSTVNEKVEHGNSGKANCSKIIEMPLDDRDFFISCSIKPRRHSDTFDNFTRQQSSSDWNYTGLCYEPIQKSDMNIFLSTGKFPSTDSYIRQPNRLVSVPPPSRSYTKESSDIYGSSPKSMSRIAAMSYKVPSIIRKRAVRTLENGLSAKDKVIRCLNGMMAMYKDPKVDDDQVENKGELVLSSPKHQKLHKSAAIKSVGKCLERAFSGNNKNKNLGTFFG